MEQSPFQYQYQFMDPYSYYGYPTSADYWRETMGGGGGNMPGWDLGGIYNPSTYGGIPWWGPISSGGGYGSQMPGVIDETGGYNPSYPTTVYGNPIENQPTSNGGGIRGAVTGAIGAIGGTLGRIFGGGSAPTDARTPTTIPSAGGSTSPTGGGGMPTNTSLNPDPGSYLNTGLNLWQLISQMNAADWNRAAIVDQLNYSRALNSIGLDRVNETYDPLRQSLLGGLDQSSQAGNGLAGQLSDMGNQIYNWSLQDPWSQERGLWQDPQMQAYRNMLGGMADQYGSMTDAGNGLLYGGGVRQNVQEMIPYATSYAMGNALPQAQTLDVMGDIYGNRGQTATSSSAAQAFLNTLSNNGMTPGMQNYQNALQGIVSGGGWTPQTQQLFNSGTSQMEGVNGIGGLTSTGAQIQKSALDTLQKQGNNPITQYMAQRGQELSASNPVLSNTEAASLARDEYYTRAKQQAEAARRQAIQRGGGAGFLAGNTQDTLGDNMDEILAGGAGTFERTLANQQGLGLQQLGQGLNSLNAGGNLATGRESTAYGGGTGIENAATSRYGTAGNIANNANNSAIQYFLNSLSSGLSAEQLATQRLTGLGGLAQNFSQDEINRMGLANNMFGNFSNSQLGNMGALNNLLGTDLSALTTGGNLMNTGLQGASGLYNTGYNAYTNNLAQNLARLGQTNTGMNTAINSMTPSLNYWNNIFSNSATGLNNIGGNWMRIINNGSPTQTGNTNTQIAPNPINPITKP